jgi:hypothetical protein
VYRLFQINTLFIIKQVIFVFKRRCKPSPILLINIQVCFMQIKHLDLKEACKSIQAFIFILRVIRIKLQFKNEAKTQKIRPKQGSKNDGLEKTIARTPRTLKTYKRRKRYG